MNFNATFKHSSIHHVSIVARLSSSRIWGHGHRERLRHARTLIRVLERPAVRCGANVTRFVHHKEGPLEVAIVFEDTCQGHVGRSGRIVAVPQQRHRLITGQEAHHYVAVTSFSTRAVIVVHVSARACNGTVTDAAWYLVCEAVRGGADRNVSVCINRCHRNRVVRLKRSHSVRDIRKMNGRNGLVWPARCRCIRRDMKPVIVLTVILEPLLVLGCDKGDTSITFDSLQ